MNTRQKSAKALAITLVALQVPLLMLWKITYDAVKLSGQRMKVSQDGRYELVFEKELLGKAIVEYLPMILALLGCLALSVLTLIFVMKRKGAMGIVGVCFCGVLLVASVGLVSAFSQPSIIPGQDHVNYLTLCEFMFYRYFGGMELPITRVFPLLQAIKFVFLGLHMTVSGVLGGLGIAELVSKRKASEATE
ncbi:MAG: hypothetical protein E7661_06550 [Ruminococcaceae bacterium]|nr:hypothetical protein [Oscillospiraceae bacterium]